MLTASISLYLSQQATAQIGNSNETVKVLLKDATQDLKNKDVKIALVHLNILNQQLAILGNKSLSVQVKVLLDDATVALKNGVDINRAIAHLNLINQLLVPGIASVTQSNKVVPTVANSTSGSQSPSQFTNPSTSAAAKPAMSPPTASFIANNVTYNDGYRAGFSKGQSDYPGLVTPNVQGSQNYVDGYNAGYRDAFAHHSLKPGTCSLSMCIADPSTNHQPTSAPLFTNPSTIK